MGWFKALLDGYRHCRAASGLGLVDRIMPFVIRDDVGMPASKASRETTGSDTRLMDACVAITDRAVDTMSTCELPTRVAT